MTEAEAETLIETWLNGKHAKVVDAILNGTLSAAETALRAIQISHGIPLEDVRTLAQMLQNHLTP